MATDTHTHRPAAAPTPGGPGQASAASDPNAPANDGPAGPSPAQAFREAVRRFAEIREYAGYLLATKIDSLRLGVRNALVMAVLGVLGLIAGAGLVVTAVVLVLRGISGGLALLIGTWGADLVTGGVVLIALAIGVYVGVTRLTKASRLKMVQKYESRKLHQRSEYGHDVDDRAQQAKTR